MRRPSHYLVTAVFDAVLKQACEKKGIISLETDAWPLVARLLYATADLRQSVRLHAQSLPSGPLRGQLLTACDRLRDDYLTAHGIRLQDRPDLPAIGLMDAKLLAVERREKAAVKILCYLHFISRCFIVRKGKLLLEYSLISTSLCLFLFKIEAEKVAAKAKQTQVKEEASRLPPSKMFRSQTDKYSAFDDKVRMFTCAALPHSFTSFFRISLLSMCVEMFPVQILNISRTQLRCLATMPTLLLFRKRSLCVLGRVFHRCLRCVRVFGTLSLPHSL